MGTMRPSSAPSGNGWMSLPMEISCSEGAAIFQHRKRPPDMSDEQKVARTWRPGVVGRAKGHAGGGAPSPQHQRLVRLHSGHHSPQRRQRRIS